MTPIAFFLRLDTRPTRFLLVGASGVAVNMCVLWLATRGAGLPPAAAGLLASIVSTFTNFLLNDLFTWRDRRSTSVRLRAVRALRYYSTTAVGNVIYLIALHTLAQVVGLHLYLANLMAIGIGGGFNFLVHNVWTWRRSEHAAVLPPLDR